MGNFENVYQQLNEEKLPLTIMSFLTAIGQRIEQLDKTISANDDARMDASTIKKLTGYSKDLKNTLNKMGKV